MTTWSLFSQLDMIVTAIGAIGLTSVFVVMVIAFSNMEKQERKIAEAVATRKAQLIAEAEEEV